jgi:hypothetical protein
MVRNDRLRHDPFQTHHAGHGLGLGARGFVCYVDGGASLDVDPARANSHAGHYPTVGIRSRSAAQAFLA